MSSEFEEENPSVSLKEVKVHTLSDSVNGSIEYKKLFLSASAPYSIIEEFYVKHMNYSYGKFRATYPSNLLGELILTV